MSGKWTPGPWWTSGKYEDDDLGCAVIAARTDCGPLPGNPTRGMVAWATGWGARSSEQSEDNARLIAASPELAAAVQIGMKDLLTAAHWAPAEYRPAFMATYEQMKNALAKAKGEGA